MPFLATDLPWDGPPQPPHIMKRLVIPLWIGLMVALYLYVVSGNQTVGNITSTSFANGRGAALIGSMILMYWLPTVIAMVRNASSGVGVSLVNLFAGWTGIGWLVAFVMAVFSRKSYD